MTATASFPKSRPGHADLGMSGASDGRAIRLPVLAIDDELFDAKLVNDAPDGAPHVLHIDRDEAAALALAILLTPEARVTHVASIEAARAVLQRQIFSAVVIDPHRLEGDASDLLPALAAIPVLVYSASEPDWRGQAGAYLPKPWTPPRRLWATIARMLGITTPTFTAD